MIYLRCWLNVLKDQHIREKIERYLFIPRPLQPDEWRTNPNTWLSNFNIDDVLGQYCSTVLEIRVYNK